MSVADSTQDIILHLAMLPEHVRSRLPCVTFPSEEDRVVGTVI